MSANCSIVLLGRFPGKDMAVAQALAQAFGMNDGWGLQIVSATPIVLLEELTQDQAVNIQNALAEVELAGSKLEIAEGESAELPKVGWNGEAVINGQPVSAFTATNMQSFETGLPPEPAQQNQQLPVPVTTSVYLPCPYTGQTIKVVIAIALARSNRIPSRNNANLPMNEAMMDSTVMPVVSQRDANAPGRPMRLTPSGLPQITNIIKTPSGSGTGVGKAATGVYSSPAAKTAFMPAPHIPSGPDNGRATRILPLPDVPILPNRHGSGTGKHSPIVAPAPAPEQDIADPNFEIMPIEDDGAHTGASSGSLKTVPGTPDMYIFDDLPKKRPDSAITSVPTALQRCSVFTNRSTDSAVHQAVAEIKGVTVTEAARMCQKASVALAENVSGDEAQRIREILAAVKAPVRIIKH